MIHRTALVLLAFSIACGRLPAVSSADNTADIGSCIPRDGLPNVAAKLAAGREVRIAYFGGSITAQPGGWRTKSLAWLQSRYPASRLGEIDATVPGTGSDLGIFRYRHDVLALKPDLVLVEFAVNDARTDPAMIERCVEGIVRQTWRTDAAIDLCFVYTISQPILADITAGTPPPSVAAMERVATHYGIPSLNFGRDVARLVAAKEVIFQSPAGAAAGSGPVVFSADGTHPLPAGHELYLQSFVAGWPRITSVAASSRGNRLVPPLRPDNLEWARMMPITRDMLQGPWQAVDLATDGNGRPFAGRLDTLWRATEAGASLAFDFRGSLAGIYGLLGPDGGKIGIQVDAEPLRTQLNIDGYATNHRLALFRFVPAGGPGRHRVTVTLSADVPDKKNILFEKNRADLREHPEKYAGNYWYAGALMLIEEPPSPAGQ